LIIPNDVPRAGILWMDGYEEQFVAHGVHMIFDGQRGRAWDDAPAAAAVGKVKQKARRYSRLVFIGIGIDRESLEKGFLACCAAGKV
jgi:G3E family GTPase